MTIDYASSTKLCAFAIGSGERMRRAIVVRSSESGVAGVIARQNCVTFKDSSFDKPFRVDSEFRQWRREIETVQQNRRVRRKQWILLF